MRSGKNSVEMISVYVHISSTSTKKSCNNRVSYDISRLVAIDLFHTHHAQILVGKKGSRIHKTPILRLNFSLSDSISSEKLLELRSSWRWGRTNKYQLLLLFLVQKSCFTNFFCRQMFD